MSAGEFTLQEWQIRLVLPHRSPLLQLDRVDRCPATLDTLEASKALGGSDPMIMRTSQMASYLAPAALIEALAQCCGLLLRLRWLANDGVDLDAFSAGDTSQIGKRIIPRSVLAESQVRFKHHMVPGQVLRMATRLILSHGDMHRFDAFARVETKVASAQIMLNFPRLDKTRAA